MKPAHAKKTQNLLKVLTNKTFRIILAIILVVGLFPHLSTTLVSNAQADEQQSVEATDNSADEAATQGESGETSENTDVKNNENLNEPEKDSTKISDDSDAQLNNNTINDEKETAEANKENSSKNSSSDSTGATSSDNTATNQNNTNLVSISKQLESGVVISVIYNKGVFPNDVKLEAEDKTTSEIENSVNEVRWQQKDDKNVLKAYTFNIKVVNANNSKESYQPNLDAGICKVAFGFNETISKTDSVRVIHTNNNNDSNLVDSASTFLDIAEEQGLDKQSAKINKKEINQKLVDSQVLTQDVVNTITGTLPNDGLDVVVADAPSFSSYTVDFTNTLTDSDLGLNGSNSLTDCLTFSSASSFTLAPSDYGKTWNGSLYYCTNDPTVAVNWTTWDGATTITSNKWSGVSNYVIYLRGDTNNTVITGKSGFIRTQAFKLTGSNISCDGNIETLRGASGNSPSPTQMASHCYSYLFADNSSLIIPPELPATSLSEGCYMFMFANTNLQRTPSIFPAETLTVDCYRSMFDYCSALKKPPEKFYAKTVSSGSCLGMFWTCTSLEYPLDISNITNVATSCFYDMYNGNNATSVLKVYSSPQTGYTRPWVCTSATTTATNWNYHMFYKTSGDVSTPELGKTYYVKDINMIQYKVDSGSWNIYDSLSDGWTAAINAATSSNTITVQLLTHWDATSGSFGSGTGFSNGALSIPSGKNIILDLNGKKIDRGLTSATSNGSVIFNYGTLTVKDSSSTSSTYFSGTGKITGGYTSGSGGGIYNGGTLNFLSGSIEDCTQTNTSDGTGGGGIFTAVGYTLVFGSSTTYPNISGCTGAYRGGGICSYGNTTINSGSIDSNYSKQWGGGIQQYGSSSSTTYTLTINGGNITNNTAVSDGGGISCDTNIVTTGGNISGNTSNSGSGGGLHVYSYVHNPQKKDMSLKNTTFTNNTCSGDGGGVQFGCLVCSNVTLDGCTITGNKAKRGSGFYGVTNINGSTTAVNYTFQGKLVIKDNTNADSVGDVYLNSGQYLKMGTFASGASIGVYTYNSPSAASAQIITSGTYSTNNSGYFFSNRSGYVSMLADTAKNVCFGYEVISVKTSSETNYEKYGTWNGGWDAANAKSGIIEVKLDGACTASSAVTVTGSKTFNFDINGNQVTTASKAQLFIVNGGATLNISDTQASNDSNAAGAIKGNGTYSGYGGAIRVAETGTLNLNSGTISGFTAARGGAIAVYGTSSGKATFTQNGGTITSCTATSTVCGGGVYVADYGTYNMKGGYITYCTASSADGGAIACYSSSSSNKAYVNMSGGTLSNNKATGSGSGAGRGGAVQASANSEFAMSGGTMTDNSASRYGGAVDVEGTTFKMTGGTISSNTSDIDGGAFELWGSGATFTSTGGSVADNTAASNGGAFVVWQGTHDFTGLKITGNTASGNGGAICTSTTTGSDTIKLVNTIITGNTASGLGSGVYYETNSNTSYPTKINVGGTTKINSNTNASTKGNVYLKDGVLLGFASVLTTGASIGVTLSNTFGTFTDANSIDYHSYFTSDASKTVNWNTYSSTSSNYHKCEILNTFTVTKNEYSGTYDKKAHSSTVSANITGAVITYCATTTGTYTSKPIEFTNVTTSTTYYKVVADGYAAQSGTLTTNITRATLSASDFTYTAPSDLVYSASNKSATITANSDITGIGAISVSYLKHNTTSSATPFNVGEYDVQISVAQGTNYEAATLKDSKNWTFKITKAPLTLTWTGNATRTYDGQQSSVTATASGYKGTDASSITISYNNTNNAYTAGTHTAEATLSGGNYANYDYSGTSTCNYTINKKQLTASVVASKIHDKTYNGDKSGYGDSDALALDGVVTPYTGTIDDVKATYTDILFTDCNAGNNKSVNVYGIDLSGTAKGNYYVSDSLSNQSTTASINPKEVSISYTLASGASLVYDHSEKTGLYSAKVPETELCYQGEVQDTCSVTLQTQVVSGTNKYDAGEHTLVATLGNSNYSIKRNSDTYNYTISPKEVTVTSVDAYTPKTYDGTNSTSGIDAVGLNGVLNEDLSDVSATATSAVYSDSNAGTDKNIVISGLSLTGGRASNYYLSAKSGTFGPSKTGQNYNTINKRPITSVSWSGYETRSYDGQASNLSATANGIIYGDSISLVIVGGTEKDANTTENPKYTAKIKELAGASKDNYQLDESAQSTQDYVITPAELTATYVGCDVVFKDELPESALNVAVTGFVNDESESSIEGYERPTVTAPSQEELTVGDHPLTPTGGSAKNYTFKYVQGNLHVRSREFSYVTAGDYVGTYDAESHTIDVQITEKGVSAVVYYYNSQQDALTNKNPSRTATPITNTNFFSLTDTGYAQWFAVEAVGYTRYVACRYVQIYPKATTISVSSIQESRVYDGTTDNEECLSASLSDILTADKDKVSLSSDLHFSTAVASLTDYKDAEITASSARLTGDSAQNYYIANSLFTFDTTTKILPKAVTPTWLNAEASDLVYSGTKKNIQCTFSEVCDADVGQSNVTVTGGDSMLVDKDDNSYTAIATITNHNYTFGKQGEASVLTATLNYKITKATLKAKYVSETCHVGDTANGAVVVTGFVGKDATSTANATIEGYVAPTMGTLSTSSVSTSEETPKNGQAQCYDFDYASGTLTVLATGDNYLSVEISGYSGTYDGSAHGVTISSVKVNSTDTVTGYNVAYYSDSAHTQSIENLIKNVEDSKTVYAVITYTYSGATLTASAQADVNINAKEVTVTWSGDVNSTYDGNEHSVSASVDSTQVVGSDSVTVTVENGTKTDAGSYTASAKKLSSTNYKLKPADTSLYKLYTINKREITLTSSGDIKQYDGEALTKDEVTDTLNSSENTGGFVGEQGATYTVTGTQTEVGSSDNLFTYTLKDGTLASNYEIGLSYGTLEVTVNTKPVVVTIVGNNNKGSYTNGEYPQYDGTAKSVTGYTVSSITLDGGATGLYTAADITSTNATTTVSGTNAGTYYMGLKGSDAEDCTFVNASTSFSNVTFNVTDGYVTIAKRSLTITSNSSTRDEYDGTALTNNNVTLTGSWVSVGKQEGATYEFTGSQTDAGSSANTFKYTLNENTTANNYDIKTVNGTLTVGKRSITLLSGDYYNCYDGESHYNKADGVTITSGSWANGETASYTDFPEQTDATDPWVAFDQCKGISNTFKISWDGTAKENNYSVTPSYGKIVVCERPVTLTSDTATKVYDGTPLTANDQENVSVSSYGFVAGEGATYTFDSSSTITNVGSQDNKFTYTLNSNTKAKNYNITTVSGTLTVTKATPVADMFTYTGVATTQYDAKTRQCSISLNSPYDGLGTETIKYYKVTTDESGTRTETELPSGSYPTDAGNYVAKLDVVEGSNFFAASNVTANTWTINIDKRKVTATSASDNKIYDGNKLENSTLTLDNFVDGQSIKATTVANVTNVSQGTVINEFEYEASNTATNLDNYAVTKKYGNLYISPRPVTLTSDTASKVYDGNELTAKNVTATYTGDTDKDAFVKNETTGQDGALYGYAGSTITDFGTIDNAFTYEEKDSTDFDNYDFTIVKGTLTIKAVEDAITVSVSGNTLADITYDAEEHSVEGYKLSATCASISGLADLYLARQSEFVRHNGDESVSGTDAGTYNYGLAVSQFSNITKNFSDVTFEIANDGGFIITPRNITYTGQSAEVTYNAELQEFNDITVEEATATSTTGLLTSKGHSFSDDKSISMSYSVKGNDVQDLKPYDGVFTGDPYITDENGKYVSNNYTCTKKPGKLVVNYRPITLTADNKSVIYDGEVVDSDTYTATSANMVDDQTLIYNFTTDPTPAQDIGTYTINVSGEKLQTNYSVTYVSGTLNVKARPVTVTANDYTTEYTGKALHPEDNLTATVTGTAPGQESLIKYKLSIPNNVVDTGSYEITSSGDRIQGNYEVSFRAGTLSVVDKSKIVIKFNNNGHGMWQDDQVIEKGGHATEPATPMAQGYEFGGWYYDAECTNPVNFEADTFDEATMLYCGWNQMNVAKVTYGSPAQSIEFNSVQEAINSTYASQEGAIVTILVDCLETTVTLKASSGNVTLDFNGHSVNGNFFVEGDSAEHHGNLTLKDTSTGAKGGIIGTLNQVASFENPDFYDVESGYYSCDPSAWVDLSKNSVLAASGTQKDKGFNCYIGKNTGKGASVVITDQILCNTEIGEGVNADDVSAIEEQIDKSTANGLANAVDENLEKEILDEAGVEEKHLDDSGNVITIEMVVTVKAESSNISDVESPYIEYSATPSAVVTVRNASGEILYQEINTIANDKLNGEPITLMLPVVGSFEPREVVHISKGGTVIDVFHKSGTYTFGYDTELKAVLLDIAEFSEIKISADVEYGSITYVDNFKESTDYYKQNEKLTSVENAEVTLDANKFAHAGYQFAGWSTREDGTGTKYSDGDTLDLTADKVLYANWTANNYAVHFDGNGADGGSTADMTMTYDAPAVALNANGFTKTHEVFLGWSTVPGGDVVYADCAAVQNLTTDVNGVVTLYAKWDGGAAYEAWLASQSTAATADFIPDFIGGLVKLFN